MFHWMLVATQAVKRVLPVADSFSNKAMHTFSRIGIHQSRSETQVCEGEKQSQLLSTTSPLWFWRRIRLVVHFRDDVLSFLCVGTSCFKNYFSSQCQKEPVSYFNQYSLIFPVYWLARGLRDRYRCLQWFFQPSHLSCFLFIVHLIYRASCIYRAFHLSSAISSIVLFDDTTWRSFPTALLVELGLFSSLRWSKSVTKFLRFSVLLQVPQKCLRWTSLPL